MSVTLSILLSTGAILSPLGVFDITVYHAEPNQTDGDPFRTADNTLWNEGDMVSARIAAVPQEHLFYFGGTIKWGDSIWIGKDDRFGGVWHVHDTMDKRYGRGIVDLLVEESVVERWDDITVMRVEERWVRGGLGENE